MKKIVIGIVGVIIVGILSVGSYILLNNHNSNKASQELKEPNEEVIVGNENTENSKKILVTYFSVPETDNPNNMTNEEENSAIVVDGKVLGNTEYVAKLISEYTKSDIYRIEPNIPYTTNHKDLVSQAKEEQDNNARPELKNKISNFNDYDVIFIGYPIWWSDMPKILYTFLELYNFDGKIVIPFSTHGGSGLSGTVKTIKDKLSNAKVEENAFTISRNNMENAPNEVNSWLEKIDY